MMQSISEIHSRIQTQYRLMQNEYETAKQSAQAELYAAYPRIAQIDGEIASLAIKSAREVIDGNMTSLEAADYVKRESSRLKGERAQIIADNKIIEYTPAYECPHCKDVGYTSDGKKCGCYMRKIQQMLLLPGERSENAVLKKSSFDKFNLSYYSNEDDPVIGVSPRDVMRVVFAGCTKYAHNFSGEDSGNLLLCGPSGLGKTLLAASIANFVTEKGYLVIYKSAYKIFQFFEDFKFGKIDRDAYSVIYDSIYDCDLLVIDDFGTEFITSYTQSVFFDLLSTRLSAGKSIIISTNLPLEKISDIYQERVMSRLKNEFDVFRFAGTDVRSLIKNQ